MNANPTPINRRQFSKKNKTKEDKIKVNIFIANAHWNDREFQMNRKKFEWADPK